MIFLCAGVYAEGPTDDRFLCNLLDRLLPSLAHEICKSAVEHGVARPIVHPRSQRRASREERIAAAIEQSWGECTLFVVHSDGAGAPDVALRQQIQPGLARARRAHPDLAAAACVPVREIEAWILADPEAFCRVFEVARAPVLPPSRSGGGDRSEANPERDTPRVRSAVRPQRSAGILCIARCGSESRSAAPPAGIPAIRGRAASRHRDASADCGRLSGHQEAHPMGGRAGQKPSGEDERDADPGPRSG